ncbi:unnamed protein product [Adineta ricciae]|uniref:Tetraspanin n=2 Tax=Adineta ricciae TaxID=249248 RepID=A0A816CV21_ADIRI|nr:unnamed protein product [Adineta ricciae]
MARLLCSIEVISVVLFALNMLFLVLGGSVLGFGIYLKASKKFDVALSPHINAQIIGGEAIEIVGVALIIIGIFTVVLSALGCLGAILRNRFFLYLYGIILTLLMLCELAAFIIMMSARVRIRDSYESGLWNVFSRAYNTSQQDVIDAIGELQQEFQCCGVYNLDDYKKVNRTVPDSCHMGQSALQPVFAKGCAQAFIDWMWDEVPIIVGVVGAILVIEIFGLIASFSLAVAMSHFAYGRLRGTFVSESNA